MTDGDVSAQGHDQAKSGGSVPTARRVAALLTAVEALIVLGFAVFFGYEVAVGAEDSLSTALGSGALILVAGIALLYLARGWARGAHWPRTPTLLWNVLLLPVAWSLHDSAQTLVALGVAVLSLASIAAALATPSHLPAALERDVE